MHSHRSPRRENTDFDPAQTSNWSKITPIGIEHSTIVLITECERKYGSLTFNYYNNAEKSNLDSFKGVMFLNYERSEESHKLKGKYINTKKGQYFEGVVGRVVFYRVSSKLIEFEKALQKIGDNNLGQLHQELENEAQQPNLYQGHPSKP